jgi:hypothetical protein
MPFPILLSRGSRTPRALRRAFTHAAGTILVLGFLLPLPARAADAPRPVVVVELDDSATAVDAAKLRTAIGKDLESDAVAPDDPRARQARGTIRVALDRDAHKLAVSYLARQVPLTRTVDLPQDPGAIERAAVILAGNLARDEASELAASLRAQRPAAGAAAEAPKAAEPLPPSHAEGWDQATPEPADRLEADRLQRTLDYLAEREHRTRLALAWTALAVGAAGIGAEAYLFSQPTGNRWPLPVTGSISVGFFLGGFFTFFEQTPFETLAAYKREGGPVGVTEETWARWASSEHRRRLVGGVVGLVASGAGVALAVWDYAGGFSSDHTTGDFIAALSAVEILISAYVLTTDGPVESALHTYERSTGKVLSLDAASLGHLRLGVVPGGATAGFAARF